MTGKQAWALLFAITTAHELTARPGELLSHEVDRSLARHPVLTIAVGAVTVAHLYNLLPERIDPFNRVAGIAALIRRKIID